MIDSIEKEPEDSCIYKRLKYLGKIDAALGKGQNVVATNKMFPKSMGIDPGWGSSPFGIVITQMTDSQIHVLYAEEFERPDFNEMLSKVWDLMTEYEFNKKNSKIYFDGANPLSSNHSNCN